MKLLVEGWIRLIGGIEISLFVIIVILGLNVFIAPEYELSTYYTPAPSYHLKHTHSKFLFLSFKLPEDNFYYKGREYVAESTFLAWLMSELIVVMLI